MIWLTSISAAKSEVCFDRLIFYEIKDGHTRKRQGGLQGVIFVEFGNSRKFHVNAQELEGVVGGKALASSLGFDNTVSLARAVKQQRVQIRIFRIEGRRGLFALRSDVSAWLGSLGKRGNQHE